MILVTLGTQDKSFERLLRAIDQEIEKGKIKERVVVQAGYTKYQSKHMEIFDLIPEEELEKLVKKCDLLITHGGVGSILLGIKNHKKIIAAARLKKYGEHTNDHQKQIIKEFVERGYIVELENFNKLAQAIEEVNHMKQKEFSSHTNKFVKNIEDYITKDHHTSWLNHFRYLSSYGYQGIFLHLIEFLFFAFLYSKYNIYLSIVISFFLTMILNFIQNQLLDISCKRKIKYLFVLKCVALGLNFLMIYICKNIFSFHLLYSQLGIYFLLMIIEVIIIRICFLRKKDN